MRCPAMYPVALQFILSKFSATIRRCLLLSTRYELLRLRRPLSYLLYHNWFKDLLFRG